MPLGNYKPFLPKHVKSIKFGTTAFTETNLTSTTIALDTSFTTNNASPLIDLVGLPDTNNPTASNAFAMSISTSGNEISVNSEPLLGADSTGSQNQELSESASSLFTVEATIVYRNIKTTQLFSSSTKAVLMEQDNGESSTTGKVNWAFNNVRVTHVGSATRNADGLLTQTVRFVVRGGEAGSAISVVQSSPSESWTRVRLGLDYAEEIRTA